MNMKKALLVLSAALLLSTSLFAQDTFKTGTNLGVERIKLAVADFKSTGGDTALLQTFNGVLWNDLDQAGIFDLVSKSFYPLAQVGRPEDVNIGAWGNAPTNAAMLAFGNFGVSGSDIQMQGWLYDTKNTASPQILGKQYREAANQDNARLIAHRFADEIIFRVGGGIQGIAESKLYFVRAAGGTKEIWSMDYDGEGQHAVTNLHAISLSPRISPDGTRLAFASTAKGSWDILMWSFDVNRLVSFPRFGGTNLSPAWSGDGSKLAFSSSRNGDPEIYTADASAGAGISRITAFKGPDVSPVWNPKTNSQIAWVSGRSGLPQIWVMNADGTNPQRLTDEGYAVSPSWSPNGQYLAFSWIRHYGPGAPGAQDIYVMDVATRQFIQLTHNGGRNDFPSWSPDNRHIVFQSSASGSEQIWTMLADGTKQKQLTFSGKNSQPNWSFK
jgi:TolB protein